MAKEKPREGEGVAVGPGRFEEGNRVAMDVKVGDRVLYSKVRRTEVKVGGEDYLVLSPGHRQAVAPRARQGSPAADAA